MGRKIYVINPCKKNTAKGKKKMAGKKKKKVGKKKPRRNPSKKRKSNVKSRGRRTLLGLNFRGVIGNMPATQLGMFAAKWAAKRFGEDATETDPTSWNYLSYIKGALGAVGASLLVSQFKPAMAQRALEGGLNFICFKAIENELIAGTGGWVEDQLGQDDDDYVPDEYLMTGEDDWFMGEDGEMYPSDEQYRLPEADYGAVLEPPGPLGFGDVLQPPGPLGFGDVLQPPGPLGQDGMQKYKEAWFTDY